VVVLFLLSSFECWNPRTDPWGRWYLNDNDGRWAVGTNFKSTYALSAGQGAWSYPALTVNADQDHPRGVVPQSLLWFFKTATYLAW